MEIQNAIFLTLLHSLWMGLVLALATGVVITATKKSTAAMRYNLLTAFLFMFVVGIGFAFYQSLTSAATAVDIAHLASNQDTEVSDGHLIAAAPDIGIIGSISSLINPLSAYSNQIVLIWFLIICLRYIQLILGLHSVYYLKRNQLYIAGRFWEIKVAELAQKLNINKKISIFQSGLAKVPMIVGYFKPVILMPIGMLNGISVAEVEAILSHELAHLKRNDYLVNILQSMIEIVFFFNPGVLWISKLIREERENCCDDLALSCTESKYQYIKALIACQEFRTDHVQYAMAITGRKHQLKDRVSRMLFDNNSTLNKMEKTVLTITLISALAITAAFNNISQPAAHESTSALVVNNPFNTESHPFSIIPEPTMGPDHLLINPNATGYQDTSKKAGKKQVVGKKSVSVTRDTKTDGGHIKPDLDGHINHAIAAETEMARQAADKAAFLEDQKQFLADKRQYEIDRLQYLRDAEQFAEDAGKHASNPEKYQEPVAPRAPKAPAAPPTPPALAAPQLPPVAKAPKAPNAPGAPGVPAPPRTSSMTADLVEDGLLKNPKNFKYTLNNEKLIINGVRQSDAVHAKYARKYLKSKKSTITTSVKSD